MIELINVAKTFGQSVPALRDVSFSVPTGSVCALLGHNGAGKTTTVNILSTLLKPTSGRAIVAGYDVAREPTAVRRNIGVTGQDAALDLRLTGRENLVLFGRLRGMRRSQARGRAEELIQQFDMAHAADRQVSGYSGGMRRRIDIAVSLVVPPKVLFLDEPTTGLDPRSRRDVWNLVASLSAQDITVLLTTQYLEEADLLSDSIVILNAGHIVARGTSDELKRQTGSSYCQMTALNRDDLPRIAAALADFEAVEVDTETMTVSVPAPHGVTTLSDVFRRMDELGVDLIDISLRRPSLDEVFLHLTSPTSTS
ncbi:MAG TPA: ATP-binding cassette domain-containing protein [Mycobacterium sp.]|nr:ATP-binding cassette domain-containing protein [Mycobacterium sp.]